MCKNQRVFSFDKAARKAFNNSWSFMVEKQADLTSLLQYDCRRNGLVNVFISDSREPQRANYLLPVGGKDSCELGVDNPSQLSQTR